MSRALTLLRQRAIATRLNRGVSMIRAGIGAVENRVGEDRVRGAVAGGVERVLETNRLSVRRDLLGRSETALPEGPVVHPMWPGRRPVALTHLRSRGVVLGLAGDELRSVTARLARALGVETRRPEALSAALGDGRSVVVASVRHALSLARVAGVPIVPLTVSASRGAGSGDDPQAALLPLPYGELLVLYGRAFALPADQIPELREELRIEIEQELRRLARAAADALTL